jgi:hypothetical protein
VQSLLLSCACANNSTVTYARISTATGAAVNVRDGIYQQTPLHRVCFKGQQEKDIYSEELLLWLVTEGRADLFAVDRFGHKVHDLYTVLCSVLSHALEYKNVLSS